MARILYVFPHPDDESFGPAPGIAAQKRKGHEVHVLTLTRGGGTKQRHRLGISVEEMGEIRFREMQCVREVLDLDSLAVHDLPDGGLEDLDPRDIEEVVRTSMRHIKPDVVVTYAAHGISGHRDHLVGHHVVKSVFVEERQKGGPARLAFFTLPENDTPSRPAHLKGSPAEKIDAREPVTEDDLRLAQMALDCYETYRSVIEEHQPLQQVQEAVVFELYQENFKEPIGGLCSRLQQ